MAVGRRSGDWVLVIGQTEIKPIAGARHWPPAVVPGKHG